MEVTPGRSFRAMGTKGFAIVWQTSHTMFGGVQASGRDFYSGKGQEVYYQPAQEYYEERGVQERGSNDPGGGYNEQVQRSDGVYYQSGNAGPSYYDEESERQYSQDYQGRDPPGEESTSDAHYLGDESQAIRGPEDSEAWNQEQRAEGMGYAEEGDGPSEQAGSGSSSRVVDEVENYYRRPESVVEDVERFYDSQGRPIYSPEDREDQVNTHSILLCLNMLLETRGVPCVLM